MTKQQAKHLRALIRKLISAEIDQSWSGSAHPDDRQEIENNLKLARVRVEYAIARLTNGGAK